MRDIREWLTCPCVQHSAERWAVGIYAAALLLFAVLAAIVSR